MMREYADYGIGMCLDEKEFADYVDLLCKEKDLDPDTYEINDDACREVLDLNDGWASGIVRYNVKTEQLDEPERLFVFKARKDLAIFTNQAYTDLNEIVQEIRDDYKLVIPENYPVEDHICEYSAAVLV